MVVLLEIVVGLFCLKVLFDNDTLWSESEPDNLSIILKLQEEKQYLDELLKNAGEYFKTIEYMCEDEKNRFMEIKKETNIIEERINNVKQYQRIVDYNLGKDKIKNE